MNASPPLPRVLLLHGIWMRGITLRPLARRLALAGFAPEIIDYHSLMQPPEMAVARVLRALQTGEPAHLVGHSLGGLVALEAARQAHDAGIAVGRVLCLGTPLTGSAAARALGQHRLLRYGLGQSAAILQAERHALPSELEVGMIAGSRQLGLGQYFAHFSDSNDGTVAVAETRLPGLALHRVFPVSHNGLILSPEVAATAARFLAEAPVRP